MKKYIVSIVMAQVIKSPIPGIDDQVSIQNEVSVLSSGSAEDAYLKIKPMVTSKYPGHVISSKVIIEAQAADLIA